MAGSTLDAIASGTRVFLDATVFIYHFTGQSLECRRLLERCERGDLGGVTCTAAVAEVTHRLMMIEAVSHGLVTAGNVARKLRERPDVVRQLHVYQTQIDRIALMDIDVAPVDLDTIARSAHFRRRYGLLTNDSIVAACADALSIPVLASADPDFAVIDGLTLHCPGDLPARQSGK
jgi:predicted nucleic acid-binding protein